MKLLIILLLAFTLATVAQPTDPQLRATWQGSTHARIAWMQPDLVRLTCLYRVPADGSQWLIGCWNNAQPGVTVVVTPPATGNHDYTLTPVAGDGYELRVDGVVHRARLGTRLRLPVLFR